MSTALSFRDFGERSPLSPATARRMRREEEQILAEAQLANERDIAQAMYVGAFIPRFSGLTEAAQQAIDENPMNVEALPVLQVYRDCAARRAQRLG